VPITLEIAFAQLVVSPFYLSLALAYGIAFAAWPLLKMKGWSGAVGSALAAGLVMLCPALIPTDKVMGRALAALICVDPFFKMIDYARHCRTVGGGQLGEYYRFLIPFPALLVVFGERDRELPARVAVGPEMARVIGGAVVAAMCFFAVFSGMAGVRSSFALDHAVKLIVFVVLIESASRMLNGMERLAGYNTRPIIQSCFLSRTPAEFWWRYNTRVHQWLEKNVFRPVGGRRAPFRGVMATFFVSAVFHELAFGLATSRLDGYQFTFFMIQAPAVLISPKLERFARRGGAIGDAAVRILTIFWMYATSILFFQSANRIFPFIYTGDPWLL
jgi:MBOAT, membrane-bound O-acyltransferase family